MGFYNFYKIIKDMIRTLFGNKILKLIIISILIFSVISITEKCFAITPNSVVVDNVTYSFTSNAWVGNYDIDKLTIVKYNNTYRALYSKYPLYFTSQGYVYSYDTNNNTTVFQYSSDARVSSNSVTFWAPPSTSSGFGTGITSSSGFSVVYSETDIYFDNDEIFSQFVAPSLGNSLNELENLSFSNFIINSNSFTDELKNNDGLLYMLFYNRSLSNPQTTDGLYPIKEKIFVDGSIYIDYENSTEDNLIFSYPIFKTGVLFNVGSTYEIKFAKVIGWYDNDTPLLEYFDNSYTFTISRDVTQDYINELNQQTATTTDEDNNKKLQDKIDNQTNAINNQTQSIDNINNSITDSTVDSSSINLPTDTTTDPTQSGVDNIFQTIYNSFTSGTAQDIVFPIPNTNKNITLSANYTYNSLQNNNASWVVTIIQAFWWYIISRFIITDIMDKIRKLKQGNLDNIENSNIKEDML